MNFGFLLTALFGTILIISTLLGYLFLQRRAALPAVAPTLATRSGRYRLPLMQAGYRQPNVPEIFYAVKLGSGLAMALACGILKMAFAPEAASAVVSMLAGGAFGFLIPDRLLEFAIKRRARRILYGIPTAIDLMILTLESGQSLDAAIQEAGHEIRPSYPELAGELNLVQNQMLGIETRSDVFRDLRERNAEPELKRLAQVFIDADRFGTSLAQALRSHLKFLRVRLRQQAQEQARKVSVKLVFPVFFLIFPAVLVVTLGPAAIRIMNQLGDLVQK